MPTWLPLLKGRVQTMGMYSRGSFRARLSTIPRTLIATTPSPSHLPARGCTLRTRVGKRFSLGSDVRSACRVAALGCNLVQSLRLLPSRDPGESQEPHPRYEWGYCSCDTKTAPNTSALEGPRA